MTTTEVALGVRPAWSSAAHSVPCSMQSSKKPSSASWSILWDSFFVGPWLETFRAGQVATHVLPSLVVSISRVSFQAPPGFKGVLLSGPEDYKGLNQCSPEGSCNAE